MSDAAKRTLRTALQSLVGLCVLLPPVLGSADLTGTLPWAAGAVAVAGGLSRLMALPAVQALLPAWLRTEVPVNGDQALRALPDPAPAPQPEPAAEPPAAGFGFTAAGDKDGGGA
jgi:hypothetical protein